MWRAESGRAGGIRSSRRVCRRRRLVFDCGIKSEPGPRRFKGGKAEKSMGVSEYGGEHRRYSWLPLERKSSLPLQALLCRSIYLSRLRRNDPTRGKFMTPMVWYEKKSSVLCALSFVLWSSDPLLWRSIFNCRLHAAAPSSAFSYFPIFSTESEELGYRIVLHVACYRA